MYSVLYVDDEDLLLGLNKIYLEKTGEFSIDTASSATVALGKIRTTRYDAVVSDYDMPQMDGIAFLKEVRRDHGDLPFLLFTGKGREDVVIEAVDNGVDFYIQKGHDMHGMIAELSYKIKRSIERRRMKVELDRSRQQLTDIINFLPDATFVRDINGKVIAWNFAMERMTGVSRDEILGKGEYEYALPLYKERIPLLADLVLEDDPEIDPRHRYFQRDGDRMSSEIYIPHFNNGRGAYLWVTAGPLYDSDGTVSGAIESFRDITDSYSIRKDLGRAQEMNQGFADMIPVGIYEMNLSHHLTFSNSICISMFGLTTEDIGGEFSILDCIEEDDRERAENDLRSIITGTSRDRGQEYLLRRKDKSTFPALIYGGKIIDPETGRPAGVRGIIIDITERKNEARELLENRERLALALRAGDIGIWDVDLRTMTIRDIHDWARQALGYRDTDLPEISIDIAKSIIHPLDYPVIVKNYILHSSGREPLLDVEFRLAAKDGDWKRVVVRGKIIERDSRGEPVRMTGTINLISHPES